MSIFGRKFILSVLAANLACLAGCVTVEPPPLYRPIDHGYGLSAAAFSPDGQLAAVANFNTIWVLDIKSRSRVLTFSGKYRFGTNNTLVFIDNEHVATTGIMSPLNEKNPRAAIRIWNIKDRYSEPLLLALPGLDRFSISLSYSAATGTLAVGGENGAVVLLEPDGAGNYRAVQLPGLSGPVLDMQFSRDGSLLAAAGVHPEVLIWSTQSLREAARLPVESPVYDLELVPGQQSLLVVGKHVNLWKFLTEEELKSFDNPSMFADVITIGAMTAVLVAMVSVGIMPSISAGSATPEPDYGFCKRLAAVSSDGGILADVHSGITKEKIRIINIAEREVVETLNPRGGNSCGLAFSPDGTRMLVANNRVARLYHTSNWRHEDLPLK